MTFPPAMALTAMPGIISRNNSESNNDLMNFAVYTLVSLPDEKGFLQAVNKSEYTEEDQVFFPPQYDFSGKTLADICHYHVDELIASQKRGAANGDRGFFDGSAPFFVAIHEDVLQHGVLLVDLSYQFFDDQESTPAVARCPVEQDGLDPNTEISAISWAVNLQIANMDMYDLLEQDGDMIWPSELPGHREVQEKLKQAGEELKQKVKTRNQRLPVRKMRYSVHHIGDPKRNQHHHVLDLNYYLEETECEDRIATTTQSCVDCRFIRGSKTLDELWQAIRKVHPKNVAKFQERPHEEWSAEWGVHPDWIFVFDNNDGMDIGDDSVVNVALVKVKWDGAVEGKTKEELELMMPELEIVDRIKTEDALARMDVLAEFNSVG